MVDADSKKCQICVVEMAKKNWCTLSTIYSINLRGCLPLATTSLGQAVYLSFIALGIYNFGLKESDER